MKTFRGRFMSGGLKGKLDVFKHYLGRAPKLGERLIVTKVTVFSKVDSDFLQIERITDFRYTETFRVQSAKAKDAIRRLWVDLNRGVSRGGWRHEVIRGGGGVVAVVFFRVSSQVQR